MFEKNMKIIGITPARGGSKAIPRKNIKEIAGKPLIAWTIEAAKKSKLMDKYFVSTEDQGIAEIARKYGAEVVGRSKELASDTATTLDVIQDFLKKEEADLIVLLQCTSPVKEEGLIDKCIQRFLDSGADSLATGFMCHFSESYYIFATIVLYNLPFFNFFYPHFLFVFFTTEKKKSN